MSESLIPSFLVSNVSELLRSLTKNEKCEWIAQVAHQKWVTMSDSLTSLRGNERSWSNRSGCSPKMSEWVNRSCFWANHSFAQFWAKNERAIRSENRWEALPCKMFINNLCISETSLMGFKIFETNSKNVRFTVPGEKINSKSVCPKYINKIFAFEITSFGCIYSRLGIHSSVFWANRTFFCEKNELMSDLLKKRAICSFAHFWWATWTICSQSLISSERPEQIAHGCLFLLSDLSDLLISLIFYEQPEQFAHIAH